MLSSTHNLIKCCKQSHPISKFIKLFTNAEVRLVFIRFKMFLLKTHNAQYLLLGKWRHLHRNERKDSGEHRQIVWTNGFVSTPYICTPALWAGEILDSVRSRDTRSQIWWLSSFLFCGGWRILKKYQIPFRHIPPIPHRISPHLSSPLRRGSQRFAVLLLFNKDL